MTEQHTVNTWITQLAVLVGVYISYEWFGFELTAVYLLGIIALLLIEILQVEHD